MRRLQLLGLMIGLLSVQSAEVQLDLHAVGPGVVRFGIPRPHVEGSSLSLIAEALGGARFVRWNDGSEEAHREIVVQSSRTSFVAEFQWDQPASQRLGLSLADIDAGQPPVADLKLQDPGYVELGFHLSARHGFRIEASTDLRVEDFASVEFISAADPGVLTTESFGGPGRLTVQLPLPEHVKSGFYRVVLDNGLAIPVLLFADVQAVSPGAEFEVHGLNLKGPSVLSAGAHVLEHEIQSQTLLKVTAPIEEGPIQISAQIDGVQAFGLIAMQVVGDENAPSIEIDPAKTAVSGGLLRVSGRHLSPNTEVWLGTRRLNVVSFSSDEQSVVAELPLDAQSGSLYAISDGVRTDSINLELGTLTRMFHAEAVTVRVTKNPEAFIQHTVGAEAVVVQSSMSPTGRMTNYNAQAESITVVSSAAAGSGLQDFHAFVDPVAVVVE